MKLGKRIVALLLVVMLMSALTACDTKPDTPQDSHLDWVYVIKTRNDGAVTKDGYYYSDGGILTYADFATGKSIVLCAKPGCTHEGESDGNNPCDAEMPFWGDQILIENDTLYYRGDANILYSRDATGGSLKELGTMAKKLIEEGKSVHARPLALCNGYLYYEGDIKGTIEDPSGGTVGTAIGYCIGRFNVAQRKDEILMLLEDADADYGEGIGFCAARENGLLYLHYEGLGPVQDWENADANTLLEATQKVPVHIKHLNLTTGETTTILTVGSVDFGSVSSVENGKLYYTKNLRDGNSTFEVHSYDLVSGKDTVVFTDVAPLSLGKGYWQCAKWLDAQTAERHIYDANTGKVLPYELKDTLGIMNYSEYGLVVLNPITGVYSFISHDSLADGLQESDLKQLYGNT